MAAPLTAEQLLTVLRAEGVHVVEHTNWRTHNRNHKGPWGPMNGVVIHHTAGRSSLGLCYEGTSDLPGPLCHTHLAKDGTATMLSAGRANHAGTFAKNAYDAVVAESSTHPRPDSAEPVDGNQHFYGLEIENMGNGKDPYPDVQYEAAVRWAAGLCRAHGWSANSVIGHKEGTRRKVDPSFDMAKFRRDVAARLKTQPGGTSSSSGSDKPVIDLSKLIAAAKSDPPKAGTPVSYAGTKTVEAALVTEGLLDKKYADGHFGELTRTAYAAWQRRCGWSGKAADGIPGKASLTKLGKRRGFDVKE
ncbi:N-acetylmuramoyl-L-alanine amidase [Streptomyces cylindrosporus]|uniref:N-acetylmuramoyl-L-alanine amidase n=1 Tax=Streptomyces cylindrosporus TaxID=2927583 RepID=A0ABS9Y2E8_9ACTN|nr:N-acetylmuramoyl-L-alanine amidase [Streptomyces cylindrosporus]MCI3271385.1 N-acetylmuramoyl-L-alanine amidase [Streptomyces cylindrosporus]